MSLTTWDREIDSDSASISVTTVVSAASAAASAVASMAASAAAVEVRLPIREGKVGEGKSSIVPEGSEGDIDLAEN